MNAVTNFKAHKHRNVGRETFVSHPQKTATEVCTNMCLCTMTWRRDRRIITCTNKQRSGKEIGPLLASPLCLPISKHLHCLIKAASMLSAWHLVLLYHTRRHNLSVISGLSHEATFRHRHAPLSRWGWQHLERKSQHSSYKTDTSKWQARGPELQDNI